MGYSELKFDGLTEVCFSVGHTKGGVGKTTIAANLATRLASINSKRVCVINLDPQKSIMDWSNRRSELEDGIEINTVDVFDCSSLEVKALLQQVTSLKKNYDFTVIDVAGGRHDTLRMACVVSDVLITPLSCSVQDTWALKDLLPIVDESSLYNDKLVHTLILNKVSTNINVNHDSSLQKALEAKGLQVIRPFISNRQVVEDSFSYGLGVVEYTEINSIRNASVSNGVSEFTAFSNKVLGFLGNSDE